MGTPPLSREVCQQAVTAMEHALQVGKSYDFAGHLIGLSGGTLYKRLRIARRMYGLVPNASPPGLEPLRDVAPEERQEARDAMFWRRRAQALEKALHDAERQLGAVSGLMSRGVRIPAWALPSPAKARDKAAGLLHVSDLHVGEVVRGDEIGGLNTYDPETFKRRIRRLFSAAIEILPRWASDCDLTGIVVAVNGDLVSGDIHDELARTNALTAHESAYLAADELSAGIRHLAEAFGGVLVAFTPGNHGRATHKTHAKRTSALNYDMLVGEMVKRAFDGDERVSFVLPSGPEAVYPVLGWTVHQSHGDSLGSGGGKGFAGPILPIARGMKNVEWQAYLVRRSYDIILTAHYHTSSNPGGGKLANGSVVGYGEFANRIRAGFEVPMQWLALVHQKWGIRERCEVKLETPEPPALPRVKVPATMERR